MRANSFTSRRVWGEVASGRDGHSPGVAGDNKLGPADLALRREEIHDVRRFRGAELADPGVTERALYNMLAPAGERGAINGPRPRACRLERFALVSRLLDSLIAFSDHDPGTRTDVGDRRCSLRWTRHEAMGGIIMSEAEGRAEAQEESEVEVERFEDQLGPFVVAAEATRMPMVFTNAKEPGHPIVFANDSFLHLTGYERDEVMAQSLSSFLAHGNDQEALTRVEAAFKGEADWQAEVEYHRKDGSTLWVGLFVSPVTDAEGKVVQHFASFHDLTQHRDAQAQSRMLIDELNHRVKNTLATVQSIVSQALRKSSDVTAAQEAIESRLFALSRSHNLLTRESWNSTGLRDVVMNALEPFGIANGRPERFSVKGPDIRMPPTAVLALGMAFHELATNAVKYGAFSNDVGRVLIDWTVEPAPEARRVILCWREINGPPVSPPTRTGFGSQMIERRLVHELEGEVSLDYRAEGLVCMISMPMP